MKKVEQNKRRKAQGLFFSISSLFIIGFVFLFSPLLPLGGVSDLLVEQLMLVCKVLFAIMFVSIFMLIAADNLDKRLINFFYYLVLFSSAAAVLLLTYFLKF